MSEFSLEQDLPSVDLSVEAVSDLEQYLIRSVANELGIQRERVYDQIEIAITDALGTETMNSIEEFVPPRFRDTTTDVAIKLRLYEESFSVRMKFSRMERSNTISMSLSADSPGEARRSVTGLVEGIEGVLETRKNLNHLCWTGGLYFGFAFFLSSSLGLVIPWDNVSKAGMLWLAAPSVVLAFIALWFPIWNEIKDGAVVPFTHFDTQRNNRFRKWAAEIWLVVFGAALSGVIGVVLAGS